MENRGEIMLINVQLKILRSFLSFEGFSLLMLFFIAMPLKYFMSFPIAVLVVGSIHGFLFAVTVYLLIKNALDEYLTLGQMTLFFILSLIPFGSFYSCRQIDMMIDGWRR
jgi:integral membrane protein